MSSVVGFAGKWGVISNAKFFQLASLVFGLSLVGCSGQGNSSNGGNNSSQFTPVNIQGQYESEVVSSANPSSVVLVETNFTQSGTSVSASAQNVVLIAGTLSNGVITLNNLGGECDNGQTGDDSVEGTFSSATQASMSLTEAGPLGTGTSTASVTFSSNGTQITSGTYTAPAACGFPADSGTVTGTQIQPFSGSYAGMLENSSGGTDAVIVSVSQSGLNLTVTGTDNGTQFTLTGTVIGATFNVSGTIAGQSVQDVGVYDVTGNDFLVYDGSNLTYLGTMNAGTNPQAAVRKGRLKPATRW